MDSGAICSTYGHSNMYRLIPIGSRNDWPSRVARYRFRSLGVGHALQSGLFWKRDTAEIGEPRTHPRRRTRYTRPGEVGRRLGVLRHPRIVRRSNSVPSAFAGADGGISYTL